MRAAFRHTGWHWIGTLLVLFNLLAPGISHAVRLADAGGIAQLQDLCSAAHGDEAAAPVLDGQALKAALEACDFCSAGLLGSAAPLPTLEGDVPRARAGADFAPAPLAGPAGACTPISATPQAP